MFLGVIVFATIGAVGGLTGLMKMEYTKAKPWEHAIMLAGSGAWYGLGAGLLIGLIGGWFHFVGAIISEGDTIGPFDMEQGDHVPFRLFFANSSGLLEESFVGQPVVQLEFVGHVPWLLGSPEPD